MRYHQPTIDYVKRRLAEGLSKTDVLRMPQTLHCPGGLPRPENRPWTHLTSIGPSVCRLVRSIVFRLRGLCL